MDESAADVAIGVMMSLESFCFPVSTTGIDIAIGDIAGELQFFHFGNWNRRRNRRDVAVELLFFHFDN